MIRLLFTIAVMATLVLPAHRSSRLPDALSVEWQGKKPSEKLYEDDQIRILRCTFPPGRSARVTNIQQTLSTR
jgi:hypothetical protein